jgi:ribose-phosphate pyrophosphokinase
MASVNPDVNQVAAFRVHLLHGNANPELAKRIGRLLNVEPLASCSVETRASGEIAVKVPLSVAGGDVFIVQPCCTNPTTGTDVNSALFELLFLVRRARLCRAARITAIVPFFPYARQDRKTQLRCPLSATAVTSFLDISGVDRVLTMDLHSGQLQGCFNNARASLEDLPYFRGFAEHLARLPWFDKESTVVVSPDAGGVQRAKKLAEALGIARIVTIIKRRAAAGVVDQMQTVGDVAKLSCIVLDDMVDTGGTLCKACAYLRQLGAVRVVACCTHGILTGNAIATVNATPELESLVVTDTLPQEQNAAACAKLVVLPTAPILARAIYSIHSELSLGKALGQEFEP